MKAKAFIYDAGAFGTAIGVILGRAGHDVKFLIQPFDQEHHDLFYNIKYGAQRYNYLHLPEAELPNARESVTDNLEDIASSDFIFLVVPSAYVWEAFRKIEPELKKNPRAILVLLTKGLDEYDGVPHGVKMMNWLRLVGYHNLAVLSGGTPAKMIPDKYIAFAASAASKNLNAIKKLKNLFIGTNLATVGTTDVAGVSLGGALKNAYAIKYGFLMGRGETDSAWEYVDSSALQEMKLFLDHIGARQNTLHSPAVKGDFRLTCQGYVNWESRNIAFGRLLASNPSPNEIKSYLAANTVEGYESAKQLWVMARKNGLKTPLLDSTIDLFGGCARL